MKKTILCFGLLIAFAVHAIAQNPYLDKANKYMDSHNYFEAIDLYKKAYSKEKNKAEKAAILFKVGECYRTISDSKNAEVYYAKAVKVNYKNPEVYLRYAEALKANGLYADAIIQFNRYKQEVPTDPRGIEGAGSCEKAQKWKDKPGRFKVDNFSAANSKNSDLSATYSAKGFRSIIYTSAREDAMGKDYDDSWGGEKNTDLFEITSDKKGKWSTPIGLPLPINSEAKEGASTMDRKYGDMYFTRCDLGKGKVVMCKIYETKRNGPALWADPTMLAFCSDSSNYGHPSLSADGNTLYFSSDREGGQGGKDIWKVDYDKKDKAWGAPVNMGPVINTAEDDLFPFIHADGTLYFSSLGHQAEGNMGGLDIFSAKFKDGNWTSVTNLKAPINSQQDDYGIIWEDTDNKGYFTSNREGGKGRDDIYSFMLPPVIFTLQGQVIDVDTKKPLEAAKVELFDNVTGTSISFTTDNSGTYKFSLAQNTSYKITANKKDYLGAKAEESTVGFEESKDFYRDFALKTTKKEIVLPNILYDLDKTALKPESKTSLDGLVETLKDNPTLVIELASHTDTRATDEHNDKLSQGRAQSVVDYLISKGIEIGRLVPRGYGEKVPRILQNDEKVVDNGKEFTFAKGTTITDAYIEKLKGGKDEQEAAHQLNRRTEFRVLRDDYVPGSTPANTGQGNTIDIPVLNEQAPVPAPIAKVDSVIAPPPVAEKMEEVKTEAPKSDEPKFYTSEKGDTYNSIAGKFSLTEEELRAINGNASGKKPKEGTSIRVVDENQYHVVQKGDSYAKVAKQYNIKATELKKINNIKEEPISKYKKLIIKNNNDTK